MSERGGIQRYEHLPTVMFNYDFYFHWRGHVEFRGNWKVGITKGRRTVRCCMTFSSADTAETPADVLPRRDWWHLHTASPSPPAASNVHSDNYIVIERGWKRAAGDVHPDRRGHWHRMTMQCMEQVCSAITRSPRLLLGGQTARRHGVCCQVFSIEESRQYSPLALVVHMSRKWIRPTNAGDSEQSPTTVWTTTESSPWFIIDSVFRLRLQVIDDIQDCQQKKNKMNSDTADFTLGAATKRTGRNIRVVFGSGSFTPSCENIMLSTKPEVHNVLHCR